MKRKKILPYGIYHINNMNEALYMYRTLKRCTDSKLCEYMQSHALSYPFIVYENDGGIYGSTRKFSYGSTNLDVFTVKDVEQMLSSTIEGNCL